MKYTFILTLVALVLFASCQQASSSKDSGPTAPSVGSASTLPDTGATTAPATVAAAITLFNSAVSAGSLNKIWDQIADAEVAALGSTSVSSIAPKFSIHGVTKQNVAPYAALAVKRVLDKALATPRDIVEGVSNKAFTFELLDDNSVSAGTGSGTISNYFDAPTKEPADGSIYTESYISKIAFTASFKVARFAGYQVGGKIIYESAISDVASFLWSSKTSTLKGETVTATIRDAEGYSIAYNGVGAKYITSYVFSQSTTVAKEYDVTVTTSIYDNSNKLIGTHDDVVTFSLLSDS